MDEPKYAGLLFGEISAMLQFNRMPVPLATLLKRQDLHSRLVNGSDYPLPAVNSLIWTRSMARAGFITAEERQALNEIYDYNPLLFDFVLKRTTAPPRNEAKARALHLHDESGAGVTEENRSIGVLEWWSADRSSVTPDSPLLLPAAYASDFFIIPSRTPPGAACARSRPDLFARSSRRRWACRPSASHRSPSASLRHSMPAVAFAVIFDGETAAWLRCATSRGRRRGCSY